MKNFLTLLQYLKPYKHLAALNVFFNILFTVFSLISIGMLIPVLNILFEQTQQVPSLVAWSWSKGALLNNLYFYMGQMVDSQGKTTTLAWICLFMIVVFFFKNLFRYLALYSIAPARNNIVRDLRQEIYSKTTALHLGYFSDQKKGDIMARMSSDVQEVEWSVLNSLETLFREPLVILLHIVVLVVMSAQLTLFVIVMLPVAGLLIGLIGRRLRKQSALVQKLYGQMLSIIEETLSGTRVIQSFGAEQYSQAKFYETNNNLARANTKALHQRDLASPMSEFLGSLVIGMVIWFGGKLIFEGSGDLKPDLFITYIAFFYQILVPAKSIAAVYGNVQKGLASADRIREILNAQVEIVDHPSAQALPSFENNICFNNVSFAYGNKMVLHNINLELSKGKIIALVGPSGGGKSTLADLLPRFIEPLNGSIVIDGKPLNQILLADLRKLLGIVSQDTVLFNDTVFNNIAFGNPYINEEAVIEAAKIAHAHEFIIELENGYQTNIGDKGSKLSGGQKQRLSIARALLKNPPILILDEATSALDTESEKLVQEALGNLVQNRTALIIAHRLSTIQHADEILVIQEGKIVERGSHQELMHQAGMYKKLIDLQQL